MEPIWSAVRKVGGTPRGQDGVVLRVAGVVAVPGRDRVAGQDRTVVFAALDRTFRLLGGVPTYVLTDNEKTVTVEHIAGIAVRNPARLVSFGRHYGVTVHTCEPADPASKGGSEAAVKISKADLVPTDANLLPELRSFAELQAAARRSWTR